MILEILGACLALLFIWLFGSWVWAMIKLRRYKKMVKSITPEEVAEHAKTIPYTIEDARKGVTPPLLAAHDAILKRRRKEWGYDD